MSFDQKATFSLPIKDNDGYFHTHFFCFLLSFSLVKMAHCCNPIVICSLARVHLCVKLLVGVQVCVCVLVCGCVCGTVMYEKRLREHCWELTCPGSVHALMSATYIIYTVYIYWLGRWVSVQTPHCFVFLMTKRQSAISFWLHFILYIIYIEKKNVL